LNELSSNVAVEPSNAHGHRPWHTPSDSLRLTFFGGSGDNLHVDNNSSVKWRSQKGKASLMTKKPDSFVAFVNE